MKIIDKTGERVSVDSVENGELFKRPEGGHRRVWIRTDMENGESVTCVRLNDGLSLEIDKDYLVEPLDGELKVWSVNAE